MDKRERGIEALAELLECSYKEALKVYEELEEE